MDRFMNVIILLNSNEISLKWGISVTFASFLATYIWFQIFFKYRQYDSNFESGVCVFSKEWGVKEYVSIVIVRNYTSQWNIHFNDFWHYFHIYNINCSTSEWMCNKHFLVLIFYQNRLFLCNFFFPLNPHSTRAGWYRPLWWLLI